MNRLKIFYVSISLHLPFTIFIISIKLHSCCFIQANANPVLYGASLNSIDPTSPTPVPLLPLKTLFYQIFYIMTHNLIPVSYNLPHAIFSPTLSTKFHPLSKSIAAQFGNPLISRKIYYEPYLILSMPHSTTTPQ